MFLVSVGRVVGVALYISVYYLGQVSIFAIGTVHVFQSFQHLGIIVNIMFLWLSKPIALFYLFYYLVG